MGDVILGRVFGISSMVQVGLKLGENEVWGVVRTEMTVVNEQHPKVDLESRQGS